MTIGIAASGPGAGRAILEALAKAEGFGTGAIGGFVSFACIGDAGLWRAGGQTGGAGGLLTTELPDGVLDAPRAVLMSSGPHRPEPLAQFTPGEASVGLVTGHRFPNQRGVEGMSLGEAALAGMRQGLGPQEAALAVVRANPLADAGLVCLGLDGRIGLANTAYVDGFPGLGRAEAEGGGARVAVLCNAITPAGPLAALIAELALAAMQPVQVYAEIVLSAGLPVRRGARPEIVVNAAMEPVEIRMTAPGAADGVWHGGYGPMARLTREGVILGHLVEEPFLTGRGDRIDSLDGKPRLAVRYAPV